MRGPGGIPLYIGNHVVAFGVVPRNMTTASFRRVVQPEGSMTTERDFEAKLAELDRLLNDPEVRMDPDRVWTILAEISGKDAWVPARA